MSTVLVNRELYLDGKRSCRHIELDITNSGLRYAAGDHVAVYPINNEELVQRFARRLNLNLDDVFSLNATDGVSPLYHIVIFLSHIVIFLSYIVLFLYH